MALTKQTKDREKLMGLLFNPGKSSSEDLLFDYKGILYLSSVCSEESFKVLEKFEAREDDLLIACSPKCGTNWVFQIINEMVSLLKNQETVLDLLTLEFGSPELIEKRKEQPSPRIMTTHLRIHNMPRSFFEKKTKILLVLRNPKDAATSYYRFHKSLPALPTYESWDLFFKDYINGNVCFGSYFEYLAEWNKHIDEDNIMVVRFEDMKTDCLTQLKTISEFLGFALTEEQLCEVERRTSFTSMKEKSENTHGKLNEAFFRKGQVGDWKSLFTEEQSKEVDAKFQQYLAVKRVREEGPVVKEIGDLMLFRFDGPPGEEVREETAKFCSCQTIALDLIKTKKRKEARFNLFMQEAESSPQCRRLQLKDLIVSEMQRLTKYPLLLENIIKHTDASSLEYEKLCRCRDRCRDILKYVNESVKQRENGYRLAEYQKRLDTTSLERTSNPLAAEFKNLDLTSRRMIHEGSLSWRITKDKTIDLHVLLLEDLLVLLQKQDEKLVLKCHSKTTVVSSDTKQTFSPVIKLNSVLVRPVATDKRAFFIICTSELGPQIYELVAMTSSEKNMWKELLEEATKNAMKNPSSSIKRGTHGLAHTRMPSVGSVLQDTVAIRSNSEDISADDSHNDFLVHSHKPDVLLEEPEGMEEDEAQTPTQVPFPSKVEDAGGGVEDQSDLNYQWPSVTEGLAESALEDVQHLRELILRSLYPLRNSDYDVAPVAEPEDDVTPTPSVTGGAGHTWEATADSALETLDGDILADHREDPPSRPSSVSESVRSVVDLTNQHRRTSNDGEESVWNLVESHPQRTSALPSETSEAASEDQTNMSYKVVRKGNVFYVVMPTVPAFPPHEEERPRETQESREYIQPMGSPSLPKSQETHKIQACSSDASSPPARSSESDVLHSDLAPNLVIQDVDMIFQTIKQLTAKLQRLQEVESAHQELLRSLRRKPPEDMSQEPELMVEEDKQPEIHHGSSVNSNSLFFVKNSVSVSIHRDSLTDPRDNALNFPMGL